MGFDEDGVRIESDGDGFAIVVTSAFDGTPERLPRFSPRSRRPTATDATSCAAIAASPFWKLRAL